MYMHWSLVALLAAAAAAGVYALIAWVCVVVVTLRPARRNPQTHPQRYPNGLPKRPTQPLTLTCPDGTRIDACYLPATGATQGAGPSIVMLHGIADSKERLLRLAHELCEMGYNALLLDFRGHGQSGGRICTYGYRERQEVRTGVDWLLERGLGPVGIYGLSLGGAVGLLAADADPRVSVVIAEGAYARLREVIGDYAARRGAFRWLQGPARFCIEKIGGMRIDDCDPLSAVGRLKIPVMLIHGLADRHVRPDCSQRLAAQMNGKCELWLVEKAPHSRCRDAAGREYANRVGRFLDRWLKSPPGDQAGPIASASRRVGSLSS